MKSGSLQGPIWGNIENVRLTEEPLRLKNPEMIAYSEGRGGSRGRDHDDDEEDPEGVHLLAMDERPPTYPMKGCCHRLPLTSRQCGPIWRRSGPTGQMMCRAGFGRLSDIPAVE
jgi:hypothetical protein